MHCMLGNRNGVWFAEGSAATVLCRTVLCRNI